MNKKLETFLKKQSFKALLHVFGQRSNDFSTFDRMKTKDNLKKVTEYTVKEKFFKNHPIEYEEKIYLGDDNHVYLLSYGIKGRRNYIVYTNLNALSFALKKIKKLTASSDPLKTLNDALEK